MHLLFGLLESENFAPLRSELPQVQDHENYIIFRGLTRIKDNMQRDNNKYILYDIGRVFCKIIGILCI